MVHTALFAEEDEPSHAASVPSGFFPAEGALPPGTYLNFFKGALYDPPACAIVENVIRPALAHNG